MGLAVIGLASPLILIEQATAGDFKHPIHFSLTINNEKVLLANNTTLDIVAGDLLIIHDASSHPQNKVGTVDRIDLTGYAPKVAQSMPQDDVGYLIKTDVDLQRKFASGSEHDEFKISAFSKKVLVASAMIRVMEPKFERVEITINNQPKQLSNGETLSLKSSDSIAIKRIFSNVRNNDNITHEIVKSGKGQQTKRELVFLRGPKVIGRIPISWQE